MAFRPTRGGGDTVKTMKHLGIVIGGLLASVAVGNAASVINLDSEPRAIVVTDSGGQSEILVAAGETLEFCQNGCFVTMPNGDRTALTGRETIEISGGVGRVR